MTREAKQFLKYSSCSDFNCSICGSEEIMDWTALFTFSAPIAKLQPQADYNSGTAQKINIYRLFLLLLFADWPGSSTSWGIELNGKIPDGALKEEEQRGGII